jgi:hypothetical protein
VARLQGELELTRAFGDSAYRAAGLISTPEVAQHDLQPGEASVGDVIIDWM